MRNSAIEMQGKRKVLNRLLHQRLLSIASCLAAGFLLSGCGPGNIEVPVWLDDSSGVVVGDEFLEINGTVTDLTSIPNPRRTISKKAHPTTRRIAFIELRIDPTRRINTGGTSYSHGEAEVQLHIHNLAASVNDAEVKESLQFHWEGKADCALDYDYHDYGGGPTNDFYWAPDGEHLVLSLGARSVVFSLKDRKWLQLPDVIVLPYFEKLFGVSPCRPDNGGFLALRMKPSKLDHPISRGTHPANPYIAFWDMYSPIFVSWTGAVQEIAVPGNARDADWLVATEWRFPGLCRWEDKCLRFSLANESLTIDTDACNVQFQILDESAKPQPKRNEVIDRVLLNGGRAEVQLVLTQDLKDVTNRIPPATGRHDLCVRLQVVNQMTGTSMPIDLGAWSQFQLVPSPDRNYVLVTNCAKDHRKPGPSLLFDANGNILKRLAYHAEYPWDFPDLWLWEAANRLYGVPVHFHSPFVPPDREYEVQTLSDDGSAYAGDATDATLEYMATVAGPVAAAREIKGLCIHSKRGRLTRDGLRHLKAFSQLKYLNISGMTIRDSDLRHFKELRRLEKLIFVKSVCTDAAIATLKQHLPGAEILHKSPSANKTQP